MSTYVSTRQLASSVPHRGTGLRRPALTATMALVAVAILATACSSGQSASTTTRTAPPGPGTSTTTTKLASAELPSVGSVLTGRDGKTLYYFTTDSPTGTTCTGQCAVVWPPLVVTGGAKAVLASGVPGTLGMVTRPDGSTQVTYQGHLLYYYEGDSAPGQDTGQGLDGTWFVATTSGGTPSAGGATTTTAGQ